MNAEEFSRQEAEDRNALEATGPKVRKKFHRTGYRQNSSSNQGQRNRSELE